MIYVHSQQLVDTRHLREQMHITEAVETVA